MGDKLCSSERLPCPVGARSCRCFQGSMVQSPGEPGADAKQGRAHGSSLLTSSGQTVGVISFRDTCDRTSIVGAGGKSFTTPTTVATFIAAKGLASRGPRWGFWDPSPLHTSAARARGMQEPPLSQVCCTDAGSGMAETVPEPVTPAQPCSPPQVPEPQVRVLGLTGEGVHSETSAELACCSGGEGASKPEEQMFVNSPNITGHSHLPEPRSFRHTPPVLLSLK